MWRPTLQDPRGGSRQWIPMRYSLATTALILWLSACAQAGGMFELPDGLWSVSVGAHRTFGVAVTNTTSHQMEWRQVEHSRDSNGVVVKGSYTVTATKMGDYHVTFAVSEIQHVGHRPHGGSPLTSALIQGLRLAIGDKVRLDMNFANSPDAVTLTAFDASLRPVFTRTLQETRPVKAPPIK